ncbi:hypothetical protein SLA2020_470690 [Shorea laevis]
MCQIKLQIILNMKNSYKIKQKQTRSYRSVSPKLQNIISLGNTGLASEVNIEEETLASPRTSTAMQGIAVKIADAGRSPNVGD